MSRVIKFRAWNGKEIIEPYSVKGGKCMMIRSCSTNDPVIRGDDGCNYYKDWDVDKPTDYPLMQFTGLSDKNGVDIYEGDIVSVFGDLLSIHWGDEDAAFVAVGNPSKTGVLNEQYIEQFEVIGNIYQNPELLK